MKLRMIGMASMLAICAPPVAIAGCDDLRPRSHSEQDLMDFARRSGECAADEYIGKFRKTLDIARQVGFAMETAERCAIPTVSLQKLVSSYEHRLGAGCDTLPTGEQRNICESVPLQYGMAIAEGRSLRKRPNPHMTDNDCVTAGASLRYFEKVFHASAQ
jgi:hypothetical protein